VADNGSGEPRQQRLEGGAVYFAPMGGFPASVLERLESEVEKTWGLEATVVDEVDIERSAIPAGNSQLDAFDLVSQVRRAYILPSERAAVLGFLTQDVRAYASGDFWNFGAVDPRGYAVISTARMDPLSFGQPPDQDLLMERLRKMTARYIGLTYFQLPYSGDPRSVLFQDIRSLPDLDRLTEWPCPHAPRVMTTC